MSDLDGLDAFNTVLDRLSTAENKVDEKQRQLHERDSTIRSLQEQIKSMASKNGSMTQELSRSVKAHEAGSSLVAAANLMLSAIRREDNIGPDPDARVKAVEELTSAVKKATEFFDEIPF